MADLQWAPNHDNEAGYIDVLVPVLTKGIQYPVYVTAGDGSVHAKGAAFVVFEMHNVTFSQYTQMRETDLAFSSVESDVSKAVTVAVPEPDRVTFNNWNATLIHRPGVDTEMDENHTRYERVYWRFTKLVAT
jgi:hypothetical protein